MKQYIESSWPGGWNPGADIKQDPNQKTGTYLIRADNISFEEDGVLRLARGNSNESTTKFGNIGGIFSTTLGNFTKVRYVYADGSLTRTSVNAHLFDTSIFTGGSNLRCTFLSALDHVFAISGAKKYKDDGTNITPIGLPAPSAPTPTAVATYTVDLNNLDGGGNYTNWTRVEGYAPNFVNAGAYVSDTPDTTTNRIFMKTAFAGTLDTTNLDGTGNDTPDDIFSFIVTLSDPDQIQWLVVELFCEVPPSALNYFYQQWSFNNFRPGDMIPPTVAPNVNTQFQLKRSDFLRGGDTSTKGWDTIKAIQVSVGMLNSTPSFQFSGFTVKGGAHSNITGDISYIVTQARTNGAYTEMSPASTATVLTLSAGSATITPAGALDANANEYWIWRLDPGSGLYLRVTTITGAFGFTPAPYHDFRTLEDLLTDASINFRYTLQYYRTALPNTIIDMIWFRDRVIYLTSSSFIPSFKLDPGSYDSRFVYELAGSSTEQCLFIVKLDVGTFIVATTRDFYRVTGTFNITIDPNDPTGETQFQDATIIPLGIADPAVSHAHVEYEGSIIYLSSTGIRGLNNGTSTLLNGNIDFMFRGESRNGYSPFQILSSDRSLAAAVTSGKRVYWSLPHADGVQRLYCLMDSNGWRQLTNGDFTGIPTTLFKEEDGTVLGGAFYSPQDYLKGVETTQAFRAARIVTTFNYGGMPNSRKDSLGFRALVNTNGNEGRLTIWGLLEDGSVDKVNLIFSSMGDSILDIDLKQKLQPCVAYAISIGSYTDLFRLDWFSIFYEERPTQVRRAIVFSDNFDKPGRKRIGTWPFVADSLKNNITANVIADGVLQPAQIFSNTTGFLTTFFWNCDATKDLRAVDWEYELICDGAMEFLKFLPPDITEETPAQSNQVILPKTNFGQPGRKRIASFPFIANLLDQTVTVKVIADEVQLPDLILSNVNQDEIKTWEYITPNDILAVDWELKIISQGIEFYKWLDPVITQICPVKTIQAISPTSNFGTTARKRIGAWGFKTNLLNAAATIRARVDGIDQTPVTANLLDQKPDEIQTFQYDPPNGLTGVDWQIKVENAGMEFYEFLAPHVIESFPTRTKYAIQPFTNFGKTGPKKISTWPMLLNTLGKDAFIKVQTDSHQFGIIKVNTPQLTTFHWNNYEDYYGNDWSIEVSSNDEIEFYKFLGPEISQLLPVGKLIDQIGPLDFSTKGIIYGFRLRGMNLYSKLDYEVYDQDTAIYSNTIDTAPYKDSTYIEVFPKGIDTSVFKILFKAPLDPQGNRQLFYRFSCELKVRLTGKESEEKYITV